MLWRKIKQEGGEELPQGLNGVAVRALSERATSEQRPQRNENASCGVVGGTGRPEVGKAKEEPGGPADRERVTERGGGEGGNLYFAVVGSMVFPPKKDMLTSCSPEPVTVTLFGKGTFACD